jgi:serine/threonine-protein kinase
MHTVAGWQLVTRIGAGGLAEVYLAEGHGRRAAVKRLLPHLEDDERLRRALRDEAELARRVRHHNVVRVDGLVEERGRGQLVMELVDGIDLSVVRARARVRRSAVPPCVAAALMAQAATALERVHAAGIVHGDVTPGNLLVTLGERIGGRGAGRLKLCDFGVAHEAGAPARAPLAASAPYLAPERIAAGRVDAGDARADAWSLGVCAWELLAGRRLFARSSTERTFAAIRALDVPPLGRDRPDVPPALAAIVERALEPDPARRATARALADAFAAWRITTGAAAEAELQSWLRSLDDGARFAAVAPSPTVPVTALLPAASARAA